MSHPLQEFKNGYYYYYYYYYIILLLIILYRYPCPGTANFLENLFKNFQEVQEKGGLTPHNV